MSGFDPNAFANEMDEDINEADAKIKDNLKTELAALKGLTPEQIEKFGGTTEQMDDIIRVVENAKSTNMSQADLVNNLKELGGATFNLAKLATGIIA